jgi:hypothetical protein
MSQRCWTLSPSDFAGLWEECPRCFYLKVARGLPRPEPGQAGAAARVAEQMKVSCDGRRTEQIAPEMPAGVFEIGERRVESEPLDVHLPDAVQRCLVRGTHDAVVRLDDGGYALADVAIDGRPAADLAAAPGRRLLACAWALEHPAPGAPALGPVTRLGLLLFAPEKFARDAAGGGALSGGVSWLEIRRDDSRLFGFLAEALSALERPEAPGGAALCPWCVYRDASRRTGL